MSQLEFLPIVERYYPIKVVVKFFVWMFCKIARYKKHLPKSYSNNVSLLALHKIGDSIFTIHAIKKIIEFHQDKTISIICFPETESIYKIAFPEINILITPHKYFWKARIAKHQAKKIFRDTKPDIIYDLTGAITSATLIAFSSTKKIVGMNLEYFKPLYDYFTPMRTTPHLIDMYMDVAHLVIPAEQNLDYEFPIKSNGSRKILIHPHAGWSAKEWGIEKYFALAKRLAPEYEVEFICEEGSLSEEIKIYIRELFVLKETKSVEELIENINDCAVFIGNDSGPIYIANMLGKPTFTIYGPTNPEFSQPFGKHHVEIHHDVSCSPRNTQYCFTDAGRKCPDYVCMHNLTVDEVYNKAIDFLTNEKIPRRIS